MARTDRQRSFIDSFRRRWIADNWHPRGVQLVTTQSNEWTATQRNAWNKALARHIVANPHIFDPDDIGSAEQSLSVELPEEETFGLGERISTFFGAAGEQANRINPFSEQNLGKTALVIGLGIVAAGVTIGYLTSRKVPQ